MKLSKTVFSDNIEWIKKDKELINTKNDHFWVNEHFTEILNYIFNLFYCHCFKWQPATLKDYTIFMIILFLYL